jgi:hypothetical protein
VARIARSTEFTFTATGINLTYDSLTDQLAIRSIFDYTHKFVTDSSPKAGVATRDLNIGVADSGKQHSH